MLSRQQIFFKMAVMGSVFLSGSSVAEPIYKATLPDGRVIYTDNIDNAYKQVTDNSQITVLDDLDSKPIPTGSNQPVLSPLATVNPAATSASLPTSTSTTTSNSLAELALMNISSTEASQQGDYQLTILSPQNDMVYHRPAQQIDITTQVEPTLKSDDSIIYTIDGQTIGRSHNTSFSFPSTTITPDKHNLTVTIVNNLDQPIATASTNFYVILTNPLIKKRKEVIAKRAAYEALPWHTKIGMYLKGDEIPVDPKKIDMKHLDIKKY